MSWKRHLDKMGIAGTLITAACCLGFPAVLAVFSAIGLGFLIHDAVLLPLLVVFLAVTLVGLFYGYRRHRRPGALLLGAASALGTLGFIFLVTVPALAYLSIAGLVAASLLNIALRRPRAPSAGA